MKIITVVITLVSLTIVNVSALAASSIELKYFGARGAAETARILLALADIDYVDTRFEITPGTMNAPDFIASKESGELDVNLARAPVLLVDDQTIGQSRTIERFLAKRFGLMGSTDIEEAQIDCIAEHCRDVKDASIRKGFSVFNRVNSDEEKATLRKEWYDSELPIMLSKVEKAVQLNSVTDGYSVGKDNSYADVSIFSLIRDCGAGDQEDMIKAVKDCSLLSTIASRIANDENVAKWIKNRPFSNF